MHSNIIRTEQITYVYIHTLCIIYIIDIYTYTYTWWFMSGFGEKGREDGGIIL